MEQSLNQFEVMEEIPRMPTTPSSPGSPVASQNSYKDLCMGEINATVDENEGL